MGTFLKYVQSCQAISNSPSLQFIVIHSLAILKNRLVSSVNSMRLPGHICSYRHIYFLCICVSTIPELMCERLGEKYIELTLWVIEISLEMRKNNYELGKL